MQVTLLTGRTTEGKSTTVTNKVKVEKSLWALEALRSTPGWWRPNSWTLPKDQLTYHQVLLPELLQLLQILILPGWWWQDGRMVRKDQLPHHQVPRGHQTNSCSINLAHFVRWRHDPWSVVTQFRTKENNCWGQTILPGGNRCRFLHLEYMPIRRLKRKGFLKTLREKNIVTHKDEEA